MNGLLYCENKEMTRNNKIKNIHLIEIYQCNSQSLLY